MMTKGMYSSKTPEWATPQKFFDALNKEFRFTLDPCANKGNAKCRRFFTAAEDGLSKDWGKERVFMNPPYGREIGAWVKKAYETATGGASWYVYCRRGRIRPGGMITV